MRPVRDPRLYDPSQVEVVKWVLATLRHSPDAPLSTSELAGLPSSSHRGRPPTPAAVDEAVRWLFQEGFLESKKPRFRSHWTPKYSVTPRGMDANLAFDGPTRRAAEVPGAIRISFRPHRLEGGYPPETFWDPETGSWYLDVPETTTLEQAKILIRRYQGIEGLLPEHLRPRTVDPLAQLSPSEMTGVEFERFLKLLFERLGYKVTLTPGSGDYGADLIVKGSDGKLAVQAKRQHAAVGVSAVQQIHAARHYYRCTRGAVITTAKFTPNAQRLAKRLKVELHDDRWIHDTVTRIVSDP